MNFDIKYENEFCNMFLMDQMLVLDNMLNMDFVEDF